MRRSVLSIIVALSVLACLSACGKDAVNTAAEISVDRQFPDSLVGARG